MLPERLIQVREIGDTTGFYWSPASADGRHLLLERGEVVLWHGACTVRDPGNWALPESAEVVVTDRRTAFLTTRFDTGGGWIGFGAVGLTLSIAANAVSKHRAAKRSAGKVAIGHVRHEWLTGLLLRHSKRLIGGMDVCLDLSVLCRSGRRTIQFWNPLVIDKEFAHWLAGVVARQRLGLAPRSPVADRDLRRYAGGGHDVPSQGRPEDVCWTFPGDIGTLIERLAPR
ncbi:hypothetical protein AAH991_38515 [Microbispora sp. ZYX-F-249]|uniref:Uncharacterized protein n=1 Tax=Microbispora maris TaxID=3144104 RepID=A0ABV0B3B8_9ACTN